MKSKDIPKRILPKMVQKKLKNLLLKMVKRRKRNLKLPQPSFLAVDLLLVSKTVHGLLSKLKRLRKKLRRPWSLKPS